MSSLTENFSWEEVIHTLQRNVDNTLPENLKANAVKTAKGMERVRASLGNFPISVSSWYRGPELNKLVGGSLKSDHLTANAVDFICPKFGSPVTIVKKLATVPKELLPFNQLILEHNWVHISFVSDPSRVPKREVLTWLGGNNYAQGITDKKGVAV